MLEFMAFIHKKYVDGLSFSYNMCNLDELNDLTYILTSKNIVNEIKVIYTLYILY